MRTVRQVLMLLIAFFCATSSSPASSQPCIGDCNGDGQVTIGELIVGVNIVLGLVPVGECAALDSDGNGNTDITDLISAVNAALLDCPPAPVPSVAGSINVPPEDQCMDCDNTGVEIISFGLVANGPPATDELLTSVTADAAGMFDTGDLSQELAAYPFSPDTNGDGRRTFIVLATVSPEGAQIGGVISLDTNAPLSKDFTGTTQVACLAAVFLTAGTEPFEDPGCVVRADCTEQGDCITSLDPDAIDDVRIDNLEEASSFIASTVIFPGGVPRAACAIISCTNGGANPTTAACVESQLASDALTITGGCRRPGPEGLVPCAPGTIVSIYRCDDAAECLDNLDARTKLADAVVADNGGFSVAVDRQQVASAQLLFEAAIDDVTLYRVIGFGPVAAASLAQLGSRVAPQIEGVQLSDVMIDPSAEAAIRLLNDNGLENFADQGIEDVIEAVRAANDESTFADLSPADAADMATEVARADPDVEQVIQASRFTPTPTVTSVPTLTPTPAPTTTFTPVPTDTPVPTFTPVPTNTPVLTNTPTPTPFLQAQISTNRGCFETGQSPVYQVGEGIVILFRIDGAVAGIPIQQADVTIFDVLPNGLVQEFSFGLQPAGVTLNFQTVVTLPSGTERVVVQATAVGVPQVAQAQCSFFVAAPPPTPPPTHPPE